MKNKSPKVSIITGAFNIKKDEADVAIQSILDQSFSDFEFIICDDGSTNDTAEMLRRWADKDKRIVLLKNKENAGLMISLNNCLKVAKGEYIARMDLDDYCVPERLAKQVTFLDNHNGHAIVSCNALLFDTDHTKPYGSREYKEYPGRGDFLFNSPFLHPGAMIRKDAMEEVFCYRVARETVRAEDYDLWMRLYARGFTGYNIQEPLLRYREDKATYARRKYKYRIHEAIVRYKGFKALGLLPAGLPYVVKPLLVGLVPSFVLKKMRSNG